jgi:hypothetical protein
MSVSLMSLCFMYVSSGVSVVKLGVWLTSKSNGSNDYVMRISKPRIWKHIFPEYSSGWL